MENKLVFGHALCYVQGTINGIDIDSTDFGNQYDHAPEEAEDYCCGDMQFDSKPSSKDILEKYHITQEEYSKICEELSEKLSFGCCGWCS